MRRSRSATLQWLLFRRTSSGRVNRARMYLYEVCDEREHPSRRARPFKGPCARGTLLERYRRRGWSSWIVELGGVGEAERVEVHSRPDLAAGTRRLVVVAGLEVHRVSVEGRRLGEVGRGAVDRQGDVVVALQVDRV